MKFLLKLLVSFLLWVYSYNYVYALNNDSKTPASCTSCHGEKGQGIIPQYPKLAGQNEKYFIKQMLAFKNGLRENTLMQDIAKSLSESELKDLAVFFAEQPINIGKANRTLIKRGQTIYRAGNKQRHIPACMACHGPAGEGNPLAGIPLLAGQNAAYTQAQLSAYRLQERTTDDRQIMRTIASSLTNNDILAISSYIEGLHRAH